MLARELELFDESEHASDNILSEIEDALKKEKSNFL